MDKKQQIINSRRVMPKSMQDLIVDLGGSWDVVHCLNEVQYSVAFLNAILFNDRLDGHESPDYSLILDGLQAIHAISMGLIELNSVFNPHKRGDLTNHGFEEKPGNRPKLMNTFSELGTASEVSKKLFELLFTINHLIVKSFRNPDSEKMTFSSDFFTGLYFIKEIANAVLLFDLDKLTDTNNES